MARKREAVSLRVRGDWPEAVGQQGSFLLSHSAKITVALLKHSSSQVLFNTCGFATFPCLSGPFL